MLKITGVKDVVSRSKNVDISRGEILEIYYNKKTGEVRALDLLGQYLFERNAYKGFSRSDSNIISCGKIYGKTTQKQVRQMVEKVV
jgi:hypothetical protein